MARVKKEDNTSREKQIIVDTDSIKKEVMEYVDGKINIEIEKAVSAKIRKEIVDDIDKANKRLLREKNKKLLIKNIFLILFFGIIILLTYLLYDNGYFDKYFNHKNVEEKTVVVKNEDSIVEEKVTLDDLISDYGNYLDSYVISSSSKYVEDFYNGNLSVELKNYMTLQSLNFDKLEVDDDYNVIDEKTFQKAYSSLFEGNFMNSSFEYNGNKIRYLSKLDSFVSDELLEKAESDISRDIIDISVDNNKVLIKTVEGIKKSNTLYSIDGSIIVDNCDEISLVDYKDKLNVITYVFNNKKLIGLNV